MKVIVVVLGLFISSCAARGPSYPEVAARVAAVPEGMARVVFFRTKESALYIARRAAISIDGSPVGATAYGGFHYADVAHGSHRLRADIWDMPGQCELVLDASANQTYYFQVDPREESFGAFALSGFVLELVSDGVLSSVAGGILGGAAESYGKSCGGGFRLYPVDPAAAQARLLELSLQE